MKTKLNGMSILAILQGVIATIYLSYYTLGFGIHLHILMANGFLLLYLLIASFGLWKRKEFGWWLTNIYYIYILIGVIISVIHSIHFQLKHSGEIVMSLFSMLPFKTMIVVLLGILVPLYLFKKNSLQYFHITNAKGKFILIFIIAILWNFIL